MNGTAMGTPIAPNYANLFLNYLESRIIDEFYKICEIWWRVTDDIFFIWKMESLCLRCTVNLHWRRSLFELEFLPSLSYGDIQLLRCHKMTKIRTPFPLFCTSSILVNPPPANVQNFTSRPHPPFTKTLNCKIS